MGTEERSWGESALYLWDLGNAFWLLCQVQIPRFSISAGTQSMTHLLHLSLNSSEAWTLPLSRISPPRKETQPVAAPVSHSCGAAQPQHPCNPCSPPGSQRTFCC